ncbi:hypothetical protein GCM10010965_24740 [Caldalkalibacillus thermarum]|uniref:DUF4242 domain-containing protein n=1 Tax=Caldalkalibacillus thermarum TaxID=296745 RepID=UPI001664463A|nr:DUF4242 domain-containing protein [Caldalkalibacillus thermarum]GGK30964.1 hypothetical protein GCM10010965_24740 [Caldalkalibacillus thermarum]
MTLYLVESVLPRQWQERQLEEKVAALTSAGQNQGVELVEVQAAQDLSRAFFIVQSKGQPEIREVFSSLGIPLTLIKQVRLVGQELEEVKQGQVKVKYVVEWNLPEGLTMEKYLARKKEKFPLYAKVPQASFLRTYVCEDMTKCLCFYDAEDEQAVLKAREVVEAPVDSITELISQVVKDGK